MIEVRYRAVRYAVKRGRMAVGTTEQDMVPKTSSGKTAGRPAIQGMAAARRVKNAGWEIITGPWSSGCDT